MRFMAVFIKSLREQLRSPLVVILTLIFGPLFVLLYALFFPSGSTTYTILVINHDRGAEVAGAHFDAAAEAIRRLRSDVAYPNGAPILKIRMAADMSEVERLLRDREAAGYVVFPEDFSEQVAAARSGDTAASTSLTFGGDLTNPYYIIAGVLTTSAIDAYAQEAAGRTPLVRYVEQPLGGSAARTEFETYVPGLFIFTSVMLIFIAAMTIAHEVEAGTLRRLMLTRMTAFDLLGGASLSLVLLGVLAEALTFLTALALGFRSTGPLWVALLAGALSSLSIIGVGMIVAAFSKSVSQAFVIANFPLALFMFFTGAVFPMPPAPLFKLAGHTVGLYEFLPPTHAVAALNKVFTLGAGPGDVVYELVMLLIWSIVYFGIGVWVFQARQMRAE